MVLTVAASISERLKVLNNQDLSSFKTEMSMFKYLYRQYVYELGGLAGSFTFKTANKKQEKLLTFSIRKYREKMAKEFRGQIFNF